jgi:hypothetical protein
MLLLEDKRAIKTISLEEFAKLLAEEERLRILGVRPFTSPVQRWMQKSCKFKQSEHKKVFNLGTWQVNWDKLVK